MRKFLRMAFVALLSLSVVMSGTATSFAEDETYTLTLIKVGTKDQVGYQITDLTMDDDITLTEEMLLACYNVGEVYATITFDFNGSGQESVSDRTGYSYADYARNWSTEDGKKTFNVGDTFGIAKDLTLYANLSVGGSSNMYARTPEPEAREGYQFLNWNDKQDGSGEHTLDAGEEVEAYDGYGTDFTMYAQWKANTYTVSFDSNGGSGEMDSLSMTYDEEKELTENAFTRKCYTFDGWNTEKDGSGDSYDNTEEVSNLTSEQNGTVTLYAQWEPFSYNVSFDANGGSGKMEDQELTYDKKEQLSICEFEKTGYVFNGWATEKDGSGDSYKDEEEVLNLSEEDDGKVTLYAKWAPISYTVSFDANGGTGEMESMTLSYDEEENLTENSFDRKGYTFGGWTTEADGNGTHYEDAASVLNLTEDDGDEITLYANWVANVYTLTFNPNGGTWEDGSADDLEIDASYDSVITIPDAPEREGYVFQYWKGSEYDPGDEYLVEGDHTFTAVWEKETVSTAENDGSGNGNTSGNSNGVKTGDDAPLGLLIFTMLAAAGSLTGMAVKRRR